MGTYTRARPAWADEEVGNTAVVAAHLNKWDQAVYDLKTMFAQPNVVIGGAGGVANSASIQAEIDSVSAAGGGIVQLPPGIIAINTTLRIEDGVWLRGSGPATDLRGTADPRIQTPASGPLPDNMTLSDFTMSGGGVGIKIDYTGNTGGSRLGWPRFVLANITAIDFGSHSFWNGTAGNISLVVLNCVSLRATGHGFKDDCTDNCYIGCVAAQGQADGFSLAGANHKLTACKAYGNYNGPGFNVGGAGRMMLSSCEAQDDLIGFLCNSSDNTLAACLADTCKTGFQINMDNNTIEGIAMHGGGGTGWTCEVGFLLKGAFGVFPRGNVVLGQSRNSVTPVAGYLERNTIRVFSGQGGGRVESAYAASYTPDPYQAETHSLVLTGNITINAPTNKHSGQRLKLEFQQDATGGRTVTFASDFRANWTPVTTANALNIIEFEWSGQFWRQLSATTGLTPGGAGIADTFDRANGAVGTSSSGHAWTVPQGAVNVISNQIGATVASYGAPAYALQDNGRGDFDMQVTWIAPDGAENMIFRYASLSSFGEVHNNGISSGSYGQGGAFNIGNGDVVRVVGSGASVSVYINGNITWCGFIPVNLGATKHGLRFSTTTERFDNFSLA